MSPTAQDSTGGRESIGRVHGDRKNTGRVHGSTGPVRGSTGRDHVGPGEKDPILWRRGDSHGSRHGRRHGS